MQGRKGRICAAVAVSSVRQPPCGGCFRGASLLTPINALLAGELQLAGLVLHRRQQRPKVRHKPIGTPTCQMEHSSTALLPVRRGRISAFRHPTGADARWGRRTAFMTARSLSTASTTAGARGSASAASASATRCAERCYRNPSAPPPRAWQLPHFYSSSHSPARHVIRSYSGILGTRLLFD